MYDGTVGGCPRVEDANQNGEDLYTVREDCTLLAVGTGVSYCVNSQTTREDEPLQFRVVKCSE